MIKNAEFLGSFTKLGKCPSESIPEYAFIGRSNVGKSSLINMLTNKKQLAKVSHTPGKTKLLNYFKIDDTWYLVDLPGYGYAKVSQSARSGFDKMIRAYLTNRINLSCVFVLIDSRIPPQKVDLEFLNWLGEMQVPFVLVFTKTDKLGNNQVAAAVNNFYNELKKDWDEMPQTFLSSAVSASGKEEILGFIDQVNQQLETTQKTQQGK
jgi:GTP-binding protein